MSTEEAALDLPGKPQRFTELDSLRGLAALTVVFSHFSPAYLHGPQFALLSKFPIRILFNGPAAVVFFFLLSGFVLSLPYRQRGVQYGSFLIRRICRIYLPYLGALLLAILGDWWHHGSVQGTGMGWDVDWLNRTWSNPPDAMLILKHILLLGDYNGVQYNGVFWSLVYEMRISLVFPFVAFVIWRLGAISSLLAAMLVSLSTFPLATHFIPSLAGNPSSISVPGFSYFQTLHFLAFFMLGAILAKHLEQASSWYAKLPRAGRLALWIASVFLYDAWLVARYLPVPQHFTSRVFFPNQEQQLLTGIGGMLIIIFALQSALFKKLLRHTVIHHIGRVSYSLYLVHLPVLFTMVRLWPKINSVWLAAAIYICATSLLTESFYHLIEKPSMELGQRLAPRRRTAPINIATVST